MPFKMKLIRSIKELQGYSLDCKRSGLTVGLVPTMGFLHAGHLSLIKSAKENGADVVIVSIFVNPTQFGPAEDFARYPRDLEHDTALCTEAGADVIFAPEVNEMYTAPLTCWVEETALTKNLCGVTRPIHFRGVATVVAKLFNAALPDIAVFGRKDAQQAAVIRRMVRDLNFPVRIITSHIVREADGLAMSSRNKYLSADEHTRALVLSRSLACLKASVESGMVTDYVGACGGVREAIEAAGGRVDYVECVDADTMQAFAENEVPPEIAYAVAAYFGPTRLIDNVSCKIPE